MCNMSGHTLIHFCNMSAVTCVTCVTCGNAGTLFFSPKNVTFRKKLYLFFCCFQTFSRKITFFYVRPPILAASLSTFGWCRMVFAYFGRLVRVSGCPGSQPLYVGEQESQNHENLRIFFLFSNFFSKNHVFLRSAEAGSQSSKTERLASKKNHGFISHLPYGRGVDPYGMIRIFGFFVCFFWFFFPQPVSSDLNAERLAAAPDPTPPKTRQDAPNPSPVTSTQRG